MCPGPAPRRVRKADVVLAILAVVALAATAVAGLSGDRWTGERTLRFATHDVALAPSPLEDVGGAGASFNWTVPDNATAANLTISLYFQGQAFRGGSATVSVRIVAPTGENEPPVTQSWVIPQGATSGEMSLTAFSMWDEAPESFRDTTSEGHGRSWSRPLEVLLTIGAPSDVPLAQYSFTAQVSGTVSVFAQA
jgi:hypothetical protein